MTHLQILLAKIAKVVESRKCLFWVAEEVAPDFRCVCVFVRVFGSRCDDAGGPARRNWRTHSAASKRVAACLSLRLRQYSLCALLKWNVF